MLGTIAAVLAIYKAQARLDTTIQQLERRVTGWQAIEFDLDRLTRRIRATGSYDEPLQERFEGVLDRQHELLRSYVDPNLNRRLRRRCEEEVLRELPTGGFFIPRRQHV